MDNLPNEIMFLFFKRLPLSDLKICRLVSKQWNNFINSRQFLKNTVLTCLNMKLFELGFVNVVNNNTLSAITGLTLAHVVLPNEVWNNNKWNEEFFAKLTMLSLDHCKYWTSSDLLVFLQKCKSLQILKLENIELDENMLNDHDAWQRLNITLQNVTELSLRKCLGLSDHMFEHLASGMKDISSLTIERLNSDNIILPQVILRLTNGCVMKFIRQNSATLKSLTLDHLLNSEILELARMPDLCLTKLFVTFVFSNDHNHIIELLKRQKITSFKFLTNQRSNQASLMDLLVLNEIGDIKHILIDDTKNIQYCIEQLKSAETLRLPQDISYLVAKKLRNGLKLSQSRESLRYLDLSKTKMDYEVFQAIINLLPQLTTLISDSSRIFCFHFKDVPNLKWNSLRELSISQTDLIESIRKMTLKGIPSPPRSLDFLADIFRIKHLNLLNLSFTNIDDISFILLINDIILLRHVNLTYCRKLTDFGFIHLAEKNSSLETIILRQTNITDNGLKKMVQQTKRLTHLDVNYCPKITRKSFEMLKDECLFLSVLEFPELEIVSWGSSSKYGVCYSVEIERAKNYPSAFDAVKFK